MLKIAVLGPVMAGKTVIVAQMMRFLENLPKIASGTYHQYVDKFTQYYIRDIRSDAKLGKVPPATVIRNEYAPLRVKIGNLGSVDQIDIEMTDYAGEIFEGFESFSELGYSIVSDIIWFVVSVRDLTETGRYQLSDFSDLVLKIFQSTHQSLKARRVIVILSKADVIQNLPVSLTSYLRDDPYSDIGARKSSDLPLLDMYKYVAGVRQVSSELEQFVMDEIEGGLSFINHMRSNKIDLHFCITSALQIDIPPNDIDPFGFTKARWAGYRVIDAFLLSLDISFQPQQLRRIILPEKRSIALIGQNVDADTVFISYKRLDWEKYVLPLVNELRAKRLAVWVDQHLILGGDDWMDEIETALKVCSRMILCVSPDALDSKHVKMEYRYFFNNNKSIFPLICRPSELPPALQTIQFYQYSQRASLIDLLVR